MPFHYSALRSVASAFAIIGSSTIWAQVDVQNVALTFNSPVSPSTSVGATTKYNNVFSVGGNEYDALVTLVAMTAGTDFTDFDNTESTQGNTPAFYSPRFNWPNGGGEATFEVSFIVDDTEANPQYVTFLNFSLNSYDLDGGVTGAGASGQSSSFSNFDSYTLSNDAFLSVDPDGDLTRFRCNTNMSSSASDIENWVKVTYTGVSTFQFKVGATSSGVAYYFLDFSEGTFSNITNGITTVGNTLTPSILSFSPSSTCTGDTVYFSGNHFSAVDSVFIGGVKASEYLIFSDDSLWAITPSFSGAAGTTVVVYNEGAGESASGYSQDASCSACSDASACNFNQAGPCTYATTWYLDADADGKGDAESSQSACTAPAGYVADGSDLCDDVTATNYNDPSNLACTYGGGAELAAVRTACDGDSDLVLDLDALHDFGSGATYSISQNIGAYATTSIVGSELTVGWSAAGVGSDTLEVQVNTEGASTLRIPLHEYHRPSRTTHLAADAASSPVANDGAVFIVLDNTYDDIAYVHLTTGTMSLTNGTLILPSGSYYVTGYTNVKGCKTTESAPMRIVVPCTRCH